MTKRHKRNKRTKSHKRTRHYRTRKMRGGNGGGLMPSVFVGAPYNAENLHPSGNHYRYNSNVEQWPSQSNAMLGGGRRRGSRMKKNKQKGGGITEFVTALLPQEVVNISRSIPSGIGHVYDKFVGAPSMASSLVYPTQQPLVASTTRSGDLMPSDLSKYYNSNNHQIPGL